MDEKAPGSSLHTERGESWIHLYWELAEREPVATAAPIYLHIEGYGKRSHDSHARGNPQQIRDVLDPAPGGWEVL
jgi:hypothetical protein